jgi:hypothetical protein
VRLFDAVRPLAPSGDEVVRFSAEPIPGYERYHVARAADDHPAVLITGLAKRTAECPPPIVLEHLAVQSDVECVIRRADGSSRHERCVVVRCRSGDRRLHEYFLRSSAAVVLAVGPEPSPKQIREAVDTLVELFRVMPALPRRSAQGLWAELFLMWQARDVRALARAWHTEAEDPYDFCAGDERLEVKSASQHRRIHDFSLEQVRSPAGVRVVVASLLVEPSAGGMSLRDLADVIRGRLAGEPELLSLRFDRVLGVTLGNAWRNASESRFDEALAKSSLHFLRADAVPAVSLPLPKEVTDVRFRADLTAVQPVEPAVLVSEGGLFGAAVRDVVVRGGRRR